MRKILPPLLIILCGFLAACAGSHETFPPRATPYLSRPEVLRHIAARPAGAAFLSFNGRWQGTDLDTRITLRTDGQAIVTYYQDMRITLRGAYTVDPAGVVHVTVPMKGVKWPSMVIRTGKQGATLWPLDRSELKHWKHFWPFRETAMQLPPTHPSNP